MSEELKKKPQGGGEGSLTLQIALALVAGVGVGWQAPSLAYGLRFLGDIFMAALMMLIVPLILVSMISGISSIGDPRDLGRLGGRVLLFFLGTTVLAVFLGLFLVNALRPGEMALPSSLVGFLERASVGARDAGWRAQMEAALQREILASSGQEDAEARERAGQLARKALGVLLAAYGVGGTSLPSQQSAPSVSRGMGILRAELIFAGVGMRRGLEYAEAMRAEKRKKTPVLTVSAFLQEQIKKLLQNPFEAATRGNVLGLIFFSIFFGMVLVQMGERARVILEVVEVLSDAMMRMVVLVMKLAPLGVFSLMALQIAESGLGILLLLGKYIFCVLLALFLHGAVVLCLFLWGMGGRSPWGFFVSVRDALGVALSTASSSASLPVTMEVLEEKAGIPKRVVRFVMPLGATVNMNGTALYEAVAAIFIAQLYGIDLSLTAQILVVLTATLAAVGAAGIPSAGTVTMVMVLAAVGLPLSGIGLLLAVDRVLDMFRTATNVWGDMVGAAVIARYEKEAGGD
jgi:Na+/H+-dicarboxylate symporter